MKPLLYLVLGVLVIACKTSSEQQTKEMSEVQEHNKATSDWQMLFDGTTFNGWHFYNGGAITTPWIIEDGAMVFNPPKNRAEGASYNIVSDTAYTNFVLSLEWKISEKGNSGIFWGVHEDASLSQPYLSGPEIQVLDNQGHPDAKNGPIRQAGALYDMVAPSKDVVNPAGQWNQCEITINHEVNQGSVTMNGVVISTFPVHGDGWDALVADSKFKDWEVFGTYRTGKIGLQDHNDKVSYRKIKIKAL